MVDTSIVIGAGNRNGTGAMTAHKFAAEGHHVIVSGRSSEKLQRICVDIESAGGSAEPYTCDLTEETQIDGLFGHVAQKSPIAAVIFNAGNNNFIPFEKIDSATFESYWRVGMLAGFLTAKRAIPLLKEQGSGSLFFTGASASMRGKPSFSHFASSKAGLRMLAQSLAREYGPQGVHVAHFIIDGVIDTEDTRTRFGDYVEGLGDEGALKPSGIADAFWYVHSQPRSSWTHELDLRPYKENW